MIGGLQCVKSGHTPSFQKTRPDGAEKEDVSEEIRTYGNPSVDDGGATGGDASSGGDGNCGGDNVGGCVD